MEKKMLGKASHLYDNYTEWRVNTFLALYLDLWRSPSVSGQSPFAQRKCGRIHSLVFIFRFQKENMIIFS